MPYRCPEIFYSTSKLTGLFEKKNINNILIVTDEGIRKFGLLDRMIMHLNIITLIISSMIRPLPIQPLLMLKRQGSFI